MTLKAPENCGRAGSHLQNRFRHARRPHPTLPKQVLRRPCPSNISRTLNRRHRLRLLLSLFNKLDFFISADSIPVYHHRRKITVFRSVFTFISSALSAAVFHFFPNIFPLFAPHKRLFANLADFRGQISLLDLFHRSKSGRLPSPANSCETRRRERNK